MTSATGASMLCLAISMLLSSFFKLWFVGKAVWIAADWKSHKGVFFLMRLYCVSQAPIKVPVSSDKFWFLTKNQAWTLPSPFENKGNYVIRYFTVIPSTSTSTPLFLRICIISILLCLQIFSFPVWVSWCVGWPQKLKSWVLKCIQVLLLVRYPRFPFSKLLYGRTNICLDSSLTDPLWWKSNSYRRRNQWCRYC